MLGSSPGDISRQYKIFGGKKYKLLHSEIRNVGAI
jgi:hypothetical protein